MTMADLAVGHEREAEREGWEAVREAAQEQRMEPVAGWSTPPPRAAPGGPGAALRTLDRAVPAGDVSAAAGAHPSDDERAEAARPVLEELIRAVAPGTRTRWRLPRRERRWLDAAGVAQGRRRRWRA